VRDWRCGAGGCAESEESGSASLLVCWGFAGREGGGGGGGLGLRLGLWGVEGLA